MTTSPNGSIVTGSGSAFYSNPLYDSSGNAWAISPWGQVAENGIIDLATDHVIELAWVGGHLWQENTSLLWYEKVGNVPGAYHGWAAGTYAAPVPISNTWIGGGNNSAGNPNDWSGHIAPRPGDTLTMKSGVMNLTGNQLKGNTLFVAQDANLVTVNISGPTSMTLYDGYFGASATSVVNIARGGTWTGSVSNGPPNSNVIVQGAGQFNNTGNTEIFGYATFGTDIVGVGTISAYASHGPGHIEFLHGVGAGQTVKLDTGYTGHFGGFVQVDAPTQFHAGVQMNEGDLFLKGLHATSAAYNGSTLSLYSGERRIDTVSIKTGAPGYPHAPDTLHVAQSAAGIDIFKSIGMPVGDTMIAMHG
jgi:hypothetical protein